MIFRIIVLLCLFSIPSWSQDKSTFNIRAKIKGLENGQMIYLAHYFGDTQYIKADSAIAKNDEVTFKGDTELKGGLYLIVLNKNKYYDILVSGNEKNFSLTADTLDFVKTVKFERSPENDILFNYRKFLAAKSETASKVQDVFKDNTASDKAKSDAGQKLRALQEEVKTYMNDIQIKHKGSFAAKVIGVNMEPDIPTEIPTLPDGKKDSMFQFRVYKKAYFDNVDFSDDRMLRTPFLHTKVDKYFKDLVYQVTDSIIVDADKVLSKTKTNKEVYRYVLWMLSNKYETTDIVGLEGVFVHLAENYYLKDATWLDSSQKAKFADRVSILKPLLTGKLFPNFVLQDTLGQNRTPYDQKSKYSVIYFYSTDCGHCQEKAPELVKFKMENKDIAVYNIAIDHHDSKQKVSDFIKKYKTGDMINLWDQKIVMDFVRRYDAYQTPTLYILDEQKRIIGRRVPVEEINKFLAFHESKMKK